VADTQPGDEVRVVGSLPTLGNWAPEKGLALSTGPDSYPTWSGILKLTGQQVQELEYKYIRLKSDGNVDWEGLCLNRRLVLATAFRNENGKGIKASKRPPRFGEPGKMDESPFEAKANSRPPTPPRSMSPASPLPVVAPLELSSPAAVATAEPQSGTGAGSADPAQVPELEIEALCRRTAPGDVLVLIGSIASIGAWSPARAMVLTTSAATYPKWNGTIKLQGVKTFEFKLAILRSHGGHDWENTQNRRVVVPAQYEPGDKFHLKVAFEGPVKNAEDIVVKKPPPARRAESQPDPASRGAMQAPHTTREGMKNKDNALVAQRCASASNLFMDIGAPTGAMWNNLDLAFGHRMAPAPGHEEHITFKLPEMPEPEIAEGLLVEFVLVEADGVKHPMTYQKEEILWSLSLEKLHLSAGIHLFYFLVNGVRILCPYFPIFNDCNAALLSSSLRKYIVAHEAGALSADADGVGGSQDRQIGKRAYSIAHNLNDVGDEMEHLPNRNTQLFFKPEVSEGLFDVELKLRLDGFTLPKAPTVPPEPVKLWSGAHVLKKSCGPCEDAFFIGPNTMGVADGVGCMVQFAQYGVNAAAYAAELMEHASQWLQADHTHEAGPESGPAERAKGAMSAAETTTQSYGASTIVVLVAEGGEIGVANLGDSGFMILRKGPQGFMVVEQSEEQQHSWNCPYQLTRLPPALAAKFPRLNLDSSSDCRVYTHLVRRGDLLLLFSDGLRDNLHDREILHIADCSLSPTFAELTGMVDKATPPEVLAKALALAAHERSLDLTAKTPFSENARKHGYDCQGGKQDDITVVAGWVLPQDSTDENSVEKVTSATVKRIVEEAREARLRQKEEEAALAVKAAAAAAEAASAGFPVTAEGTPSSAGRAAVVPPLHLSSIASHGPSADSKAVQAAEAKVAEALTRAATEAEVPTQKLDAEAKPLASNPAETNGTNAGSDVLYDRSNEDVRESTDAAKRVESDSQKAVPEAAAMTTSVKEAPTGVAGVGNALLSQMGRLHSASARLNGAPLRVSLPPYDSGRTEVSRRRRADNRPVSKAKQ